MGVIAEIEKYVTQLENMIEWRRHNIPKTDEIIRSDDRGYVVALEDVISDLKRILGWDMEYE